MGLPWWLSWERIRLQCRRSGFNPWVRRTPWRRKWLPTLVFLPEKSPGQRSLSGYSPWGCKQVTKPPPSNPVLTTSAKTLFPSKVTFWGSRRTWSFVQTPFSPVQDQFMKFPEGNGRAFGLWARNNHEGLLTGSKQICTPEHGCPLPASHLTGSEYLSSQLPAPGCFVNEFKRGGLPSAGGCFRNLFLYFLSETLCFWKLCLAVPHDTGRSLMH